MKNDQNERDTLKGEQLLPSDCMNTPWTYSEMGQKVFGKDTGGGDVLILDVRGWGYLTGQGTGALGLSDEEAAAIQDQRGKLLAAAPDLLTALKELVAEVRENHPIEWSGFPGVNHARAAIARAEGQS